MDRVDIDDQHSDIDAERSDIDFAGDPYFTTAEFCLPAAIKGCIPKARNQKRACMCYAFPAVDAIFADYFLSNGSARLLAVQEILDNIHIAYPPLDPKKWADHINQEVLGYPGSFRKVFRYAREHGIYLETQYPYKGKVETFVPPKLLPEVKVKIRSATRIPDGRHDLVVRALDKKPVTGSLYFVKSLREFRGDGIYRGPTDEEYAEINDKIEKDAPVPHHGVLLIGYGGKGTDEYYICQNYSGPEWGHKGCFKAVRNLITRCWYPEGTRVTRVPLHE